MSLTPGTRLGQYEILDAIGAGGMGQVYRARDTRLNRTVAIKALHELFADHPERVARFDREAQLLASLNHPNIAAIHGLEESQGSKYLVLEFVDGRPLSEVLSAGALPHAEALAIARQIADALAAAHERGIIHRDLKPGNVMVTAEGQVKVLDFGLGKALESESTTSGAANSPTMTMAATQQGIILGTAGYMSPEQAKGRTADKRSDVWSFGCVLFECLTGKRAFDGEDITETLAAIVRGEPDWKALPPGVSPQIRTLVERCLVKDRAQRISDMSVVRYLLSEPAGTMTTVAAAPAPAARSIGWPLVAGIAAVCMLVTAGAMRVFMHPAAPAAAGIVPHLALTLPDDDELAGVNQRPIAVSPNGAMVVYTAMHDGKIQLFLRSITERASKAIEGTEGAKSPFFSPNNQWIAFFAQGKLKKVTVGGTGLKVVTDAQDARGGAWGSDDTIYFTPTNTTGLWKVPASGGQPASELTHVDRAQGEISHRWPHALPDGQTLLFTIWTGPGPDEHRIVRQSLAANGARHVLVQGGDTPGYVSAGSAGYLLYAHLDALFAMPWTPSQTDLSGVVPVALPVLPRLESEGASAYAVSDEGTLLYLAGGPARRAQRLVWVDRAGKVEPLPTPDREYDGVAISPDGKQAAMQIVEGIMGLWLYDFARQTMTPFMTRGGSSQAPVWTADGKHIIYRATRNGSRNLYWKAADGTGEEEPLSTKPDVIQTPESVSPDGHWLVYLEAGLGTPSSLWRLALDGDRKGDPILTVKAPVTNGRISPDGKWIAAESSASGRIEVSVAPFPGPGPQRQVSVGGGAAPLWSRNSRELFYTTADKLMAVDVAPGPALSVGSPRLVSEGRFRVIFNANTAYDISLDGRRFLRIQQAETERAASGIDVVLNWFTELKRVATAK